METDALILTWEERRFTRGRRRTRAGREIAVAPPTGTVLSAGDVVAEGDGWRVVVEAAEEAVLALAPRDRAEAVRVAFEVGNHHGALAIAGEEILVPDEKGMRILLGRLGVSFEERRAVFEPLSRHGHGHDHD